MWLALPPEMWSQTHVRVVGARPAGFTGQVRSVGANRLAHTVLGPGESVRVEAYAFLPLADSGSQGCTAVDEPSLYLGSNLLVELTPEVRSEAREVAGSLDSPEAKAGRLLVHVLRSCSYRWPPSARGSEAMRRERRGDCGQYAMLYAALCRSVDIPCRVLFGTLAGRAARPHAWAEVHLPRTGWQVADFGLRELELGSSVRVGLSRVRVDDDRYLLRGSRADRLAFSVDPVVPLDPPFQAKDLPEGSRQMVVAGRPFAWGHETLEGAAPYLQPCYVRFERDHSPRSQAELLGKWRLRIS